MTEAPLDVLCIGNAIVDVIARVDDRFIESQGLVKGSMAIIDEERAGTLCAGMGQAIEVSGGSAGNTAAGVASFGAKAAFIGKVRDDQLGSIFRHDMQAQGVRFDSVAAKEGPATARSFILVTPDGERTMNTYLGASVNLHPADIDAGIVGGASVTYMEGYLWDRPQAKDAFKLTAKIARAQQRMTAITLSDAFCVERHRESFLDLIRNGIDIVFANESEIKSLYRTESFDSAREAIRRDCSMAVLTRSAAGSVVVKSGETHVIPAYPVKKVVDLTGAGDLFAAGFLFGFTSGKPLRHCAELGALAAAEVISHMGARPEVELESHARAAGLL
ncbi:MAG TPA: adenosine kinase [Aestuariivirga sp.]|nr:adenosine kinase [Aestuariivirga sp.]